MFFPWELFPLNSVCKTFTNLLLKSIIFKLRSVDEGSRMKFNFSLLHEVQVSGRFQLEISPCSKVKALFLLSSACHLVLLCWSKIHLLTLFQFVSYMFPAWLRLLRWRWNLILSEERSLQVFYFVSKCSGRLLGKADRCVKRQTYLLASFCFVGRP